MYTANTTPIKVALDFLSIHSDLRNDHVNRLMRKTRLHFCQGNVFWGINQPNVLWIHFPEVLKTGNVLEKHFLARFVAVWKRPPINGGWAVYLWKRRSNNLLMLTKPM